MRIIAIIGTLSGMLFGLEGCTGDLLDTSPSYSFSSSNVWTSPILARAAVMGVYNELYEKFSKNYDSPSIGIPFDAWSSVMDIDMSHMNAFLLVDDIDLLIVEITSHPLIQFPDNRHQLRNHLFQIGLMMLSTTLIMSRKWMTARKHD